MNKGNRMKGGKCVDARRTHGGEESQGLKLGFCNWVLDEEGMRGTRTTRAAVHMNSEDPYIDTP
jgi:hypothetical protein